MDLLELQRCTTERNRAQRVQMSRTVRPSVVWLGSNVHAGHVRLLMDEPDNLNRFRYWSTQCYLQNAVQRMLYKAGQIRRRYKTYEERCARIDERSLRVIFNGKDLTLLYYVGKTDAQKLAHQNRVAFAWRQLYECKSPVTLVLTRFSEADVANDAAAEARLKEQFYERARQHDRRALLRH